MMPIPYAIINFEIDKQELAFVTWKRHYGIHMCYVVRTGGFHGQGFPQNLRIVAINLPYKSD